MTPDVKKSVRVPIHGNPFKRGQITGHLEVAIDDGQEMPPTVIENGQEVKLSRTRPLHKPQDVGIPRWLQDEDK